MQGIQVEIGKLMAHVEGFQKQLCDIKKDVAASKKEIQTVHTELMNFMAEVQTKPACQKLHDRLGREYVSRVELAPLKSVANAIVITSVTAICVAILNLILK